MNWNKLNTIGAAARRYLGLSVIGTYVPLEKGKMETEFTRAIFNQDEALDIEISTKKSGDTLSPDDPLGRRYPTHEGRIKKLFKSTVWSRHYSYGPKIHDVRLDIFYDEEEDRKYLMVMGPTSRVGEFLFNVLGMDMSLLEDKSIKKFTAVVEFGETKDTQRDQTTWEDWYDKEAG